MPIERKLKVLLLIHELSPTGAPKVALSAFQRFTDAVELRTLAYLGGPLGGEFGKLGPVQTLVTYGWPGMSAPLPSLARFAGHRALSLVKGRLWAGPLRRWQPDVIYINSVAALLAVRRLALPPAPVLLHVHELDHVLAPFMEHSPDLLRDLPSRYVAVSSAVADALTGRFGIDPQKVTVVPAFVEAAPEIAPVAPSAAPAVRADTRWIVGGAGVINWCKGAQLWLLMAAEVKRLLGADKVRFVWVGVPENEEGWQFGEMARKLHLTSDIEFVPFTRRPQDYYQKFDVFALTSWEETASLALLENMLLERAVVCFAGSGGPVEFAGDAGVALPNFSPHEMAEAIAALCADPARRLTLGKAARQRVLNNFTAEVQAPHILEEIKQLAGRGLPPHPPQ
jgi:glycosyltransferase involved in cell wall biosynthesis